MATELLRAAARAPSPDAVDAAVQAAFAAPHPDHAPLLAALLLIPDHHNHEDIARLLQKLRAPDMAVIRALQRTALAPPQRHLDMDDGHALARKCTWALADTGTAAAHAALKAIASTTPDAVIAAYATRRLDLWEAEAARKPSETATG